jgi:hypothetical protein
METLSGTTTVNAAFLREIKEDHHELRQLLREADQHLAVPRVPQGGPQRLVDLLARLRDRVAMHFSLEESFGYFDDALTVAPRLSKRAEVLRAQHQTLFLDCCGLVERAERLLYHESHHGTLRGLAEAFVAFEVRLRRHEAAENELIMQAFMEDVGGGD